MKKIYKLFLIGKLFLLSLTGCSLKKDYRDYKDKIWISEQVQGEEEGTADSRFKSFSFRIREIDEENISGEISIAEEAGILDEYFDIFSIEEKKGSFSGKITNGVAVCSFDDSKGNQGTFTIRTWEKDGLKVEVKYDEKTWENRKAEDGTYFFSAYLVSDIKGFVSQGEREINLADSSRAELVTGRMENLEEGFDYPQVYVADSEGVILCRLDMGTLFGTEIADIRLEDMNGDGTEDVSIMIQYDMENVEDREGRIEWAYYQRPEGGFEIREEERDYEEYLRKVWVVKSDKGENVYGMDVGFRITDISDGIVRGKFEVQGLADMTSFYGSDLEGRIINNIADCIITEKISGSYNYGRAVLKFCDDGNIEVLSRYNHVYQHEVSERYEGRYLCRSYNISDMIEREIIDEYTFETELDGWGDVWIVTMLTDVFSEKGYYGSEAYIANENRDVLFEFDVDSDPYLKISNVVIEDYDGNGIEDVEFYLTMTESHDEEVVRGELKNTVIYVFTQSSPGEFKGVYVLDAETGEECIPYEVFYRY